MRKLQSLILLIMLFALVFTGCEKKDNSSDDANCTRYEFVQWNLDEDVHTAYEVEQLTGNSDLFLKLYEDGTAKICISDKVQEMQYEGSSIWLVDEPNNKMLLTIEGDQVKMVDGEYTFLFKKEE